MERNIVDTTTYMERYALHGKFLLISLPVLSGKAKAKAKNWAIQ